MCASTLAQLRIVQSKKVRKTRIETRLWNMRLGWKKGGEKANMRDFHAMPHAIWPSRFHGVKVHTGKVRSIAMT